jgi:hypothetical protein
MVVYSVGNWSFRSRALASVFLKNITINYMAYIQSKAYLQNDLQNFVSCGDTLGERETGVRHRKALTSSHRPLTSSSPPPPESTLNVKIPPSWIRQYTTFLLRWKRSRKLPSLVKTLAALGRLLAFASFDADELEGWGDGVEGNWGCGVEPDNGVELEDFGVEAIVVTNKRLSWRVHSDTFLA